MKTKLLYLFLSAGINSIISTFSYSQFTTLWTQTNNPSISWDHATDITSDTSGIYIAGYDGLPQQWRIEKRTLNTGAIIWSQVSDPSSGIDGANVIAVDTSGIYIAGYDNTPGDWQWRIEKRNLITGTLIPSFGIAGVVTSNPSSGPNGDIPYAIVADTSGIYVAGIDDSLGNYEWRIEKRNLTTGALIWVRTNNLSANPDYAWAVTIDTSGVYIAGTDGNPGTWLWHIEKRNLSTGSLIWAQTNTISGSGDIDITVDASGIYLAGDDDSLGNGQWRIEKRDLSTGLLIPTFGNGGIVTNNPSAGDDGAVAITNDASGIYVAGYDNSPSGTDYQWRIEKRDLITGTLICIHTNNFSIGDDTPLSITTDSSGIYVAGYDNNPGGNDDQWRIEKYDVICLTSVLENISNKLNLSISPNPFSFQTVLQSDNLLLNATLTVDNTFGQTVAQIKNISGQTIVLHRDNLTSGLYFVHLTQDSKVIATKKLIITD